MYPKIFIECRQLFNKSTHSSLNLRTGEDGVLLHHTFRFLSPSPLFCGVYMSIYVCKSIKCVVRSTFSTCFHTAKHPLTTAWLSFAPHHFFDPPYCLHNSLPPIILNEITQNLPLILTLAGELATTCLVSRCIVRHRYDGNRSL